MAIAKNIGWANIGLVLVREDDGTIRSVVTNIEPKIALTGTGSKFDKAPREGWCNFEDFTLGTPYDKWIAEGSDVKRRIVGREIPDNATMAQIETAIADFIKTQAGIV
jgi:hypothetical protein